MKNRLRKPLNEPTDDQIEADIEAAAARLVAVAEAEVAALNGQSVVACVVLLLGASMAAKKHSDGFMVLASVMNQSGLLRMVLQQNARAVSADDIGQPAGRA